MNTVIEVNNVSKKYDLHTEGRPYKILQKDILKYIKDPLYLFKRKKIKKEFWALKNVSFQLYKGEIVGIIGQNGSGKSTLLRILGQITTPTKGNVVIRGKVNSLLEVGPGFHTELTGRENVFLNGVILGLTKKEIEEKFAEIVDFSGVGKFIDIPVKYYSTGMHIRLAFSIGAHLNSDILLIDEILSVGDAEFQKKSFEKIERITRKENRTVIFVSHDMRVVQQICDRVFLLEKGQIKEQGGAQDVTRVYLGHVKTLSDKYEHENVKEIPRGSLHIVSNRVYKSTQPEKAEVFTTPEAIKINKARIEHLESLKLPLKGKTVLDVGAGIGILAQYFVQNDCDATCIDGRFENINSLRSQYPHLKNKSFVVDVERDDLNPLGIFDIIFCYGLIYHVEKPELVLEKLSKLTRELLLLETCITDHPEPFNLWAEETSSYNQALQGVGSRPTPSFIISSLHQAGFTYVYFPKNRPKHEDFQFRYSGDFSNSRDNHLLRQIFVASKKEILNSSLQLVSFHNSESNLNKDLQIIPSKSLSKISTKELIKLATLHYSPLPLLPIPSWSMGRLEYNKDSLRQHLMFIWEELVSRNKTSRETIDVQWYNGLHLLLYPRNEICRSIFIEGCYEPNELYFLSGILKSGMCMVDVGANIGIYSLFAARLVGEKGLVLAIEPSSREYKRFLQQIRRNKLRNIRVRKLALFNKSADTILSVADERHAGHNTLSTFAYDEVKLLKKEKISCDTLDNLIKEEKIRKIDVIKIDVEGSELFTLYGAKKTIVKNKPVIILEISNRNLEKSGVNPDKLLSFLTSLSYRIFKFNKFSGRLEKCRNKVQLESENIIAIHKSNEDLTQKVYE